MSKRVRLPNEIAEKIGLTINKSGQYRISDEKTAERAIELRESYYDREKEPELDIKGVTQKYDLEKGNMEVKAYYDHPPTPEEVIADHKVDENKFKLSSFYTKGKSKGWLVTALFSKLKSEDTFQDDFKDFLRNYKSPHKEIVDYDLTDESPQGELLINKQDAHLNKYDEFGDNNIEKRFKEYRKAVANTVNDASISHCLNKITYVIGSDILNSEFTQATTNGTPQKNTHSYSESFRLICDHEVSVINYLLSKTENVEVVLIQGNHDENAGWHLIHWLKAYYKDQERLNIDSEERYTKFRTFMDSAVCLNHGASVKPKQLAENFATAFKDGYYNSNFYYVITGDKHTEKTQQFGQVKWYQIPLQHKAKSRWDEKMGFTESPCEMLSFLFEKGKGIRHIIREPF